MRFTESVLALAGRQHFNGLRTIGFRRHVTIAFTVEADAVTIIGIFYGGQDYESDQHDQEEP